MPWSENDHPRDDKGRFSDVAKSHGYEYRGKDRTGQNDVYEHPNGAKLSVGRYDWGHKSSTGTFSVGQTAAEFDAYMKKSGSVPQTASHSEVEHQATVKQKASEAKITANAGAKAWEKLDIGETPQEQAAFQRYCGGGYDVVNTYLRGDQETLQQYERENPQMVKNDIAIIPHIDSLFQKLPKLSKPATVYRGVRDFNHRPGEVFSDPGYVSTSLSEKSAGEFAGESGAILEIIDAPAGSPFINVAAARLGMSHPGEREVLFNRGQQFKVISEETGPDGRKRVKLQMIQDEPPPMASDEINPDLLAMLQSIIDHDKNKEVDEDAQYIANMTPEDKQRAIDKFSTPVDEDFEFYDAKGNRVLFK